MFELVHGRGVTSWLGHQVSLTERLALQIRLRHFGSFLYSHVGTASFLVQGPSHLLVLLRNASHPTLIVKVLRFGALGHELVVHFVY